jgi:hypothetical protein
VPTCGLPLRRADAAVPAGAATALLLVHLDSVGDEPQFYCSQIAEQLRDHRDLSVLLPFRWGSLDSLDLAS